MSLFSFLRKNKQESDTDDSTFYSRAEEDSKAVRGRARGRTRGKGEEAADPVLPEKKRARRRLIGAVALVLAAVVGLPMVLDSEPKPLAEDIAIQIPSREKAPPRPAGNKAVTASAALDEQEEVVEPPAAPPAADKPAAPPAHAAATADKPALDKTASDKPAIDKPAEDKPAAALARPERKPEARPAESQDDARARALLEGKPDPRVEKKDSGKYVIQVAALATKDKVNELQSRLKSAGIKSYTQTVSTASGERTRIRVGPFASKDEAEKVRARIVEIGLNGTLVPA